ncbi:MAG: hypothetical protein Q8R82_12565 [Hyphomonadaceae bacterium]|nr:hypothetical protein [Hyphomonadaceae bacterium]
MPSEKEGDVARSYAELMGLEFEAERLVRQGTSRAEVSRRLGVHPQTLSTWALRGGWRKKDLDMERSGEATHKTLQAIRDGNRAADAQAEMRAQLAGLMREAVALLADGGEEAMGRLERMLAGVEAPRRLEAVKVELGPDRLAGGMRSLGDARPADGGAEDGVHVTEDGEAWSPEVQRRLNRERGRPDRVKRS